MGKSMFKVGDMVHVRMFRSAGGCVMYPQGHPEYSDQPIVPCTISGVNICGVPGCYSLRFADTGEHVGLPCYAWMFVDAMTPRSRPSRFRSCSAERSGPID